MSNNKPLRKTNKSDFRESYRLKERDELEEIPLDKETKDLIDRNNAMAPTTFTIERGPGEYKKIFIK